MLLAGYEQSVEINNNQQVQALPKVTILFITSGSMHSTAHLYEMHNPSLRHSRGGKGAILPPKFLAHLNVLCFDIQWPKPNTVACLTPWELGYDNSYLKISLKPAVVSCFTNTIAPPPIALESWSNPQTIQQVSSLHSKKNFGWGLQIFCEWHHKWSSF